MLLYRRAGGVAGWAFLTVWCVAAAAFLIDFGLDRAIASDIRGRRIGHARDCWLRWNPSLFYHRAASQIAINEAIASTVRGSASFEQALLRMVDWRRDPVRLDRAFEVARDELAGRGEPILAGTAYAPPGATVAPWWDDAWEIGLWPSDAGQWSRLVGRLGARQLLLSLADGGSDPFTWPGGRLRGFEAEALEAYAGEVVGRYGLGNWGDPRHRLVLMAPTRDWPALREAATAGIRGNDPPRESPEALAFVTHAPFERVRPWLAANLGPSTKGYVLNAIGKSVETRGDPDSMFVLLDLADFGRLPYDPFSRLGRSLALPDSPRTVALAVERILKWLATGSPPRASVLRCLLRVVGGGGGLDGLDPGKRNAFVGQLVGLLDRAFAAVAEGDPDCPYRETAAPAYEAIARGGSAEGTAYLCRELEAWVAQRHGGPEERESLLRGLRRSNPDDLAGRALRLAIATREDATQWRYDDSAVQAEYLLALAARPQHPERHTEFVASLLGLYASAATKPLLERPFFLASARQGFVALFGRLDDGELGLLFRRSCPEGSTKRNSVCGGRSSCRPQERGAEGPGGDRVGRPRRTGATPPSVRADRALPAGRGDPGLGRLSVPLG